MSNEKVAVGGFTNDAVETALALALEEVAGGVDFAFAEKSNRRKQGCEGLDDDCDEDDDDHDSEYNELIDEMILDGYTDAEAIRMIHILEDQGLQTGIKK